MNDITSTRAMPQNIDAERFILGSILTDSDAYRLVSGIIEAGDFSIEKHRRIWWRMADLAGRGDQIDRVSLANELMKQDQLESVDGLGYICSLDEGLPRIRNIEVYCQIVREKAILRKAIIGAQGFIDQCMTDSDPEVIEKAATFYRELSTESSQKQMDLQSLGEFIENLPGGLEEFFNPKRLQPCVPLPWPGLSEILGGGLRKSELVVIAGRPGHGKSAVAGQIAHHAATASGKAVALFSLEMDADQIWYRIIAAAAQVPLQKWRKGRVNEFEKHEFQAQATMVAEAPVWISDKPSATLGAIRAAITRHKAAKRLLDLVIIDYIQLMQVGRKMDSRAQEVSEICRELKLFAKELAIPIVALAQVRRYPDSATKPPGLDHLKESGAIEENADIVIFVWANEKDREVAMSKRPPEAFKVRLAVGKQRNGPIKYVEALFSSRYVRLDEELEQNRDSAEF